MVAGVVLSGLRLAEAEDAASGAMALSTHVLDAAAGKPVGGVPVKLEQGGAVVAQGKTDQDGRLALGPASLAPGTYRLSFDIQATNNQSFYPEIVVTFRLTEPQTHLHLPILLSPFAYSTYRGS
jgi:5-hydroxyisourate hydrolase